MKKLNLLVLLVLSVFASFGQYGHRTYYVDTLTNEWFNDGLVTDQLLVNGKPVYAACGRAQSILPGSIERARFMRAAWSGTTNANRHYFIFRNGVELPGRLNSLAEAGNSFVMSGSVAGSQNLVPGGRDIMVMKANGTGLPSSVNKVDMGGGADEAFCTRRSAKSPSAFYTCGTTTLQGVGSAFLMKHNSTLSSINWVRRFSLPCSGSSAVQAEAVSVIDDSASGSVVVIGNVRNNSPTLSCQTAFIAKFSQSGVLQWLHYIVPSNVAYLEVQSIRATQTAQEYIIAGSAFIAGLNNYRVMLLRVNTSGASPVYVMGRMQLSAGPTPNFPVSEQKGYDVVGRFDSLNINYEYYIAAHTKYTFGTTDGCIIKTNAVGVPLAMKIYFGSGNGEFYAIDKISGYSSPGDGIAAFGRLDEIVASGAAPVSRSWLGKSYFNLVTGCIEIADNPTSQTLVVNFNSFNPSIVNTYTRDSLQFQYGSAQTKKICWATSVAGGLNTREASDPVPMSSEALSGFSMYPNPGGQGSVFLTVNSNLETNASFQVMDVNGRIVEFSRFGLSEGVNDYSLDLGTLPSGIYLVRLITDEGESASFRWVRE